MILNKKNLLKFKFSIQFLFELIIYFPFLIIFLFKKKVINNFTLFLSFKYRMYKNDPNNLVNYDDVNLVKNFSEKTNSAYNIFYIDTQNKFVDFFMNLRVLIEIFKQNPKYMVCYIDYAVNRFNLSVSLLYLINKFRLTKMMLISPDSVWKINIYRARIFEKNQIVYYGDRNLLINKHSKKRMCPVNFTSDFFRYSKNDIVNKKIDVLYIGRIQNIEDRTKGLAKLRELINIKIIDTDQTHLPINEYIKMISSSKIVINFNTSKNKKIHFKGKSLEIIACGSLLFEPKNSYLNKNFLTSGKHYVEFKDIEDLINKINYYNNNLDQLKKISGDGNNALLKLFEKRCIWKYLLDETKY